MSYKYPCPGRRCCKMTTWIGNGNDVGGLSTCSSCGLSGTNAMRTCPTCKKPNFLYPSSCASCSGLPGQAYQLMPGMTLTTANGSVIHGPKTGAGIVLLVGNNTYITGSVGDVRINGNLTVGIPK